MPERALVTQREVFASREPGLCLCGAACHGGPGVTFIPGYNAGYEVLEAADR